MPKLNSRGDVAHGVGGGFVNVNNQAHRQGGAGGWMDDDRVACVDGTIGWIPSSFNVRTGAFDPLPGAVGANAIFGGGGHAVWMFATTSPDRGLTATTGFRLPDGAPLGMGPDGAIGYKPLYHSNGPSHVRELDGSDWLLTHGHASALQLLGQRRAIWIEGWSIGVANIPQPMQAQTTEIWKPEAAFAGGEWWISYYTSAHGITLHPFASLEGFSILSKGNGWHTIREIAPNIIRVAIASAEGEQAGEIWVRDYDVVANAVRDPWGRNVWEPAARIDVRKINEVQPVEEQFENGWFPRLSRGGLVVSGFGFVTHRGKKLMEPGGKPKWFEDGKSIAAMGPGDEIFVVNIDGTGMRREAGVPPGHVWGAGAGKVRIASPNPNPREIFIEVDPVTGDEVTIVEHGGSNDDRSLLLNGRPIIEHVPLTDPRAFAGFIVWRQWPMPSRTMGFIDGQVRDLSVMARDWEGNPVPIVTDQGRWVLFMTNVDLRLHPIDSKEGYIIPTGEDLNFNPDAMGMGNKIRVVWQTHRGERFTRDISLDEPRTDTSAPLSQANPVCGREYKRGEGGSCPQCGNPKSAHKVKGEEPVANFRSFEQYFERRWNELGIPEKTAELARRLRVTPRERTYLAKIAEARRDLEAGRRSAPLKAPTPRANGLEEQFKAVQVPALVQIVAELYHNEGNRDAGLSVKNGGNRWKLPDGRSIATDIVAVRPTDGAGNVVPGEHAVVDTIVSVGSAEARPSWMVHGVNEDSSRPWMEPPLPEGKIPEPGDGTHRYIGGGNDTGECDTCGRGRMDPVHKVPEAEDPHEYDGGEQDTGQCDICQKGPDDPLHRGDSVEQHVYTPSRVGHGPCLKCGEPADNTAFHFKPEKHKPQVREGDVHCNVCGWRADDAQVHEKEQQMDKHKFSGSAKAKFCEECGQGRDAEIHRISVPQPTGDLAETNRLLGEILEVEREQVQKLDELRTGVQSAVRDFGKQITDALKGGGLIDLLKSPRKEDKG